MYLGQTSKYKIFALEIHHCDEEKLQKIISACEAVEKDVWNAGEDFSTYVKKQSALIYAKQEDQVVGFALFDVSIRDGNLITAANECMVLRSHHGFGLPTLFMSILILHIRKDNRLRGYKRKYKSITFLSTTVNFKLMEAFRRYSFLASSTSFSPDSTTLEIAREYCAKEVYDLIDEEHPFFLKAAFPDAVKTTSAIEVPTYVPKDFTALRGDAFLYVCRLNNFLFLGLMSWFVQKRYGFRFSNRLIPISRIAREHVIYSR